MTDTTDLTTTDLTLPPSIENALAVLESGEVTVEDKAAVYAVLHQVQLRINRVLRKVKDELIYHMEQEGPIGPLSVKATAQDVTFPCNDEANWTDATIQDTIRDVVLPVTPEFVRHVPDHYEINTRALGEAVHAGDPAGIQLWREMNSRGWRREGARRLSIAVAEAKGKKEAA